MSRYNVELDFGVGVPPPDTRTTASWRGVSAEFVQVRGEDRFAYGWSGESHYLALHDIKLVDGEAEMDEVAPMRLLDLRGRMTFAPAGSRVTGWSAVTPRRAHSFTALFFDPAIIAEEFDARLQPFQGTPMLYFERPWLQSVLGKIQGLLQSLSAADSLYAETLGLMAVLEIERLSRSGSDPAVPASGRLSAVQERSVRDYIADNLPLQITLSELAGVAGLSRFHFARAFRQTFGLPPHRYVLDRRLEAGKQLLVQTDETIAQVAGSLGFRTPAHFSSAFRAATGVTPNQFRRGAR